MISLDESIGASKNLLDEEKPLPPIPHQRLVVSPFNLLNGTGWMRYPQKVVRAHSANLLFNILLPGKSPEACKLIRLLGKKFPNCSVTVLHEEGLTEVAKHAHVRLVTRKTLHLLRLPKLTDNI